MRILVDMSKLSTGVKQKKSELRVYCDLLMQQVLDIKEASSADPLDSQVSMSTPMTLPVASYVLYWVEWNYLVI